MGRSGYSEDCENLGLWRGAVDRAIRGKRGQAFLRELAATLDAMPNKQLIAGEVVRDSEHVCALGSVAVARGANVADLDIYDREDVAKVFGVAPALAAEIAFVNDDDFRWNNTETPEARWMRMRAWVDDQLIPAPADTSSSDTKETNG